MLYGYICIIISIISKYFTKSSTGLPSYWESVVVQLTRNGKCFVKLEEAGPIVEGYWNIQGVDICCGKLVKSFIA